MTIQEKIDIIFSTIENLIHESLHMSAIINKTSKMVDLSKRDLNVFIMFFTGKTLPEYITERKIMNALKGIHELNDLSCDELARKAGFDNVESFVRCFKKIFKITPQEAFGNRHVDLYEPLPTWCNIMGNQYYNPRHICAPNLYEYDEEPFNIDIESYQLRKSFDDAIELHNLPMDYVEIVYEIVSERNITPQFFDMIFNYISEWLDKSFEKLAGNSTVAERYRFVRENARNPEMQFLCLQMGFSIDLSVKLQERVPDGIYLRSRTSDFTEGFAQLPYMTYYEYKEAYEYFTTFIRQNSAINDICGAFQKYISLLENKVPKEEAINILCTEKTIYEKYTEKCIP